MIIRENSAYKHLIHQLNKSNIVYEEIHNRTNGKVTVSFNITKIPYELSESFGLGGKYSRYVESYDVHTKKVKVIFDESVMNPTPVPYEYEPVSSKILVLKELELDTIDDDLEEDLEVFSPETSYELVGHKRVNDTDGFLNDYAWWRSSDGENIFILYDLDRYDESDVPMMDSDWETYDESEAQEWFDNYDNDYYEESMNPFKSHFICQGCGKPLDQCICDIEDEDRVDEEFSSCSATQSSSVGSHKRGSIDLIDAEDEDDVLKLNI